MLQFFAALAIFGGIGAVAWGFLSYTSRELLATNLVLVGVAAFVFAVALGVWRCAALLDRASPLVDVREKDKGVPIR